MGRSQACLQALKHTTPKKTYNFSCGHGYPWWKTLAATLFGWQICLKNSYATEWPHSWIYCIKSMYYFFMPAPEELTPRVYTLRLSLCVSEQCLSTFCEAGCMCSFRSTAEIAVLARTLEETSSKVFQNVSNDILMYIELNQTRGWNVGNRKMSLNLWVFSKSWREGQIK